MVFGPLQALLKEEEALKQQIKERGETAVAAGYERRSSLGSDQAPKSSAARRDSIQSCREARRPSTSSGSVSANVESLIKPTLTSQMKTAQNRKSIAPVQEEKPELSPEEIEEQRQKWDHFHVRNSVFLQTKEKFIESQRLKREEQEMVGCTFRPQKSQAAATRAASSGSMYDRAQRSEEKKQKRMAQLRQELFDREMAQCSFHPRISAAPERGQSTGSSRRSSFSSCVSMSSAHGYPATKRIPVLAT